MTAVGTTTSRLKLSPISFNNYAHIFILFFPIGRRFSSWSCGCEDVTWPKRKETALRFWIYVMLDDINAECTNHRTCRYLFNVMQVIRRVMTSFYTLFSQEERNCHNILMAKVYKVVDQPGKSNVLCLTTNWNKCVLCPPDTERICSSLQLLPRSSPVSL